MDENILDGGEAILQACRDLGIDYLMSSPGSEWGPVWEALGRQQVEQIPGPTYLNCGHELLAVDLAVGYTAMTGRMQAVLLHAGVGLMQGSMGLHGAKHAELPLLVMSGESTSFGASAGFDPGAQWYNNHNIAGSMQTFARPFVKWAHQPASVARLYEFVLRAGQIAQSVPAGPTYLDIPIEVMLAKWLPAGEPRKLPPATRMRPSTSDIEKVAELLLAAKNPVVVTVSAGRSQQTFEALVDLAELWSLPVVESPSSDVNSFPTDHPLHQGFEPNPVLQDADVLLAVRNRTPWYPPRANAFDGRVVIIDESPLRTDMAYQDLRADVVLAGDVTSSVQLLAGSLRASAHHTAPIRSRVEERKVRWKARHEQLHQRQRDVLAKARAASGIHPVAMAATLRDVLPTNTIYVDETTLHLGTNRGYLSLQEPQSYLAMRSGLGQGLGVALGVKLARRDRPVACLIGDGAFLYNPALPCFGFAKANDLPILVIIYNNHGYRSMRDSQTSYYADGTGVRNELFFGATIDGFHYEEIVRPFGGFGARVEKPADLIPALRQALAALADGRCAIVNVVLAD